MSNIRIDIASEFKDRGFKRAESATVKLNRSFTNLQRTATRTFIAIAGVRALKASVNAFAAEDKAAKQLAQSLRNLGLAYNTSAIEDYLEKAEKATAINKDELSPAITQLISTTLDAKESMKLLNVAMDVSTSTGKDLRTVTTALTRAYNGNFAALGKIQTSYTAAELEAMGFSKTVEVLSTQFGGAALANAQTYSGQIELLKIALGDASEELGKGLLDGLAQLSNGNYSAGLENIVKLGEFIGDVFRRAGLSIRYAKEFLSTGWTISDEERRRLEEIRALFDNPMAASNRRANSPAANRQFLADYKKQQQLQKKIEDDRKKAAALTAKTEKERLKREKEAQALKRAGTVFDMENIQIVAAMQNKINDNERLRLTALLALNTGNAEAAEKLSTAVLAANAAALANLGVMMKSGDNISDVIRKIIEAQASAAILGKGIGNIPKAPNPFEAWPSIIAGLLAQIGQLNGAINGLGKGGTGGAGGGNGSGNPLTGKGGNSGVGGETVTVPSAITPPPGVNTNLGGGFTMGANQYPNSSYFAGIAATSPYIPSSYFATAPNYATTPPTVVVNIAGNVTAEQDLIDAITEGLYTVQKRGQAITYNAVAL